MRALSIALLGLALAGCNEPRYQIEMSKTSNVSYRLDTQTGEVWFCRGVDCRLASAPTSE